MQVPSTAEGRSPDDSVVLVDPATHLPISSTRHAGTEFESAETYGYLPRTPDNLALLEPPAVPDGYTETALPANDTNDGEWPESICTT